MPSAHVHDNRLRFVCFESLNTVWVPKCGVTTSDSRRKVGGDAICFLIPPFPHFRWNMGRWWLHLMAKRICNNRKVNCPRKNHVSLVGWLPWCRWRPLWRDISVLTRVFELRVSEKSDSRTANLVNVCANLFYTCGDQGSSFRISFPFVSTLNSTRSTLFGARPLANQDWGFLSSDVWEFEDWCFRLRNMMECKYSHMIRAMDVCNLSHASAELMAVFYKKRHKVLISCKIID